MLQSLPEQTTSSVGVLSLFSKYGDNEMFCKTFAPVNIPKYASFPLRCIAGTAPTVHVMEQAYGHSIAMGWLSLQFAFLNKISNAQVKLDNYQCECLASAILSNEDFQCLKVTDIMLFINQFITGKYGHFYGAVDAQVIGEALYKYRTWKRTELANIHRKQQDALRRMQREQWLNDPRNITREEYLQTIK